MSYESDRLVSVVEKLCFRLERPVSSKDLLAYFRAHPDERPLLMQRLGQNLFKLGKQRDRRIHRLGIIGNLAFYAPSISEQWSERFDLHRAVILLKEQSFYRMPEHALPLLTTRFQPLIRNALAGFIAEWFPLWRRLDRQMRSTDFQSLLEIAERNALSSFIPSMPACSPRAAAADLLKEEYVRRTPLADPNCINTGRHLVHLRPSSLLEVPIESFWLERVKIYCGARWPMSEAETNFCRGLSLAMAYGPIDGDGSVG